MFSVPVKVARVVAMLAGFVALSMVAGSLAAGLFLPLLGAAGVSTKAAVNLFQTAPVISVDVQPSEYSTMYASDGKTIIARFADENRVLVSYDKIAPAMRNAIVAIEDNRFYQHGAIDPQGILRAVMHNAFASSTQGASTLTQQYIKNLRLEQAVQENNVAAQKAAVATTPARKIEEMRAAIALEQHTTKNEILTGYLNIAYFNNRVYGIEAAARHYFSTNASKLTIPQAAMLAGMVQNPTKFDPQKYPKNTLTRRNLVLLDMKNLKMITEEQYASAIKTGLRLKIRTLKSGCYTAGITSYFCDYVKALLVQDSRFKALGSTQTERTQTLSRGGLKIVTSLDIKLEKAAYKKATAAVPLGNKDHVVAAATTVDPQTGRVVAMVQTTSQTKGVGKGHRGKTSLNYNVDKVYGGSNGFPTGSTYKAFTLTQWLKDGRSLNDSINGTSLAIPVKDFTVCGKSLPSTEIYHFGNSENGENGSVSILKATSGSINSAFVAMETKLDLCDIQSTAKSIGVHNASVTYDCKTGKRTLTLTKCPSLTLGPAPITPLTMASAYGAFANDGSYCKTIAVLSIKDRNGKTLSVPKSSCKQSLSADVAHGVTYALKGVFHGTASHVSTSGLGPVAGKTGTANSSIDTWFVGYTKQYSTAVWVANPLPYKGSHAVSGQKPLVGLKYVKIGRHQTVFGATIAGPIWSGIMKSAMKGVAHKDWPNPPSSMLAGGGGDTSGTVPDVAGMSVSQAIGKITSAGYSYKIGGTVSGSQSAGKVERTDPAAGSAVSQGDSITIYISDGSKANGRGNGNGRGNNG